MSNDTHIFVLSLNDFSGEQQMALEGMETHDIMYLLQPIKITILKVPGGYLYMIGDLTVTTFVPEKKILLKQSNTNTNAKRTNM